jgi:hypothetical protein
VKLWRVTIYFTCLSQGKAPRRLDGRKDYAVNAVTDECAVAIARSLVNGNGAASGVAIKDGDFAPRAELVPAGIVEL